jgi:hypothetical protein
MLTLQITQAFLAQFAISHMTPNQKINKIRKLFVKTIMFFASAAATFWRVA